MGAALVTRSPDGLALTTLGEKALPLVEEIERAVLAARDLVASHKTRVRLATPSGFSRVISPHLAAFQARHPDITIELLGGSRMVDLKKGEADVAIRQGPSGDEDLVARQIGDVGWSLYASEAYLGRHPAPGNPRDLAGHDVLGFETTLSRVPGSSWLEEHGKGANVIMRCRELMEMVSACVAGIGLAVLPCMAAALEPSLRRLTGEVLGTQAHGGLSQGDASGGAHPGGDRVRHRDHAPGRRPDVRPELTAQLWRGHVRVASCRCDGCVRFSGIGLAWRAARGGEGGAGGAPGRCGPRRGRRPGRRRVDAADGRRPGREPQLVLPGRRSLLPAVRGHGLQPLLARSVRGGSRDVPLVPALDLLHHPMRLRGPGLPRGLHPDLRVPGLRPGGRPVCERQRLRAARLLRHLPPTPPRPRPPLPVPSPSRPGARLTARRLSTDAARRRFPRGCRSAGHLHRPAPLLRIPGQRRRPDDLPGPGDAAEGKIPCAPPPSWSTGAPACASEPARSPHHHLDQSIAGRSPARPPRDPPSRGPRWRRRSRRWWDRGRRPRRR